MTKKKSWRAFAVFNALGELVGIGMNSDDAWFYVENDYLGSAGKKEWREKGFKEEKIWVVKEKSQ